jgi:glutamate N-acetyltransferase/amino-acid N-acetyltransferase
VAFDPALVTVTIGDLPVYELGVRAPAFDEAAVHEIMLGRDYTIRLDMGLGTAESRFLTCDLTEEYVRINADYSS